MHGLPKHTDLGFLIGKQVFHLCFGEYHTSIGFDHVAISMEGKHVYSIAEENRVVVWERGSPPNADLLRLLGKVVSEAAVIEVGTVELSFSQGDTLRLFDDSTQYESYQISSENRSIVV